MTQREAFVLLLLGVLFLVGASFAFWGPWALVGAGVVTVVAALLIPTRDGEP